MPEQNESPENRAARPDGEQPAFRLQKMYVKDLSFESPHAPQVFLKPGQEPRVEFNLNLKHAHISDDNYELSLNITAKVLDRADNDKVLFIIELEHAALFLLRGIPEEHIDRALSVEAAFMLFPFTRQLITQLSLDGGFMPFMMEPINFAALYDQLRKQRQEQQES